MKPSLILLILGFCLFTHAASKEDILVTWWSPEQKTKVQFYEEKEKIFGKIIAVRPESENKLDIKNPDKNQQSRKILGLVILKNFNFNGDRWTDGTIYDPENGKTYKSIF